MTEATISPESPHDPEVVALLQASYDYLNGLYDPEDNHVLSVDALAAPDILFFVARAEGRAIGTVALALRNGYAEVKSLYVDPAGRGRGVARALMQRATHEARRRGLPVLRLETGTLNTEALALYARLGFEPCGPFGDYEAAEVSVFLQKWLEMPRRMGAAEDMRGVLKLLQDSFAYMDGVIDPPSSLARVTLDDLATAAREAELWVIGAQPFACMILTPQPDTLYLGKLAVDAARRGTGVARVMIDTALERARTLGLPSVTLQTRVELTANHDTFRRLGFAEIARTAHAGYDRPTSVTFQRRV